MKNGKKLIQACAFVGVVAVSTSFAAFAADNDLPEGPSEVVKSINVNLAKIKEDMTARNIDVHGKDTFNGVGGIYFQSGDNKLNLLEVDNNINITDLRVEDGASSTVGLTYFGDTTVNDVIINRNIDIDSLSVSGEGTSSSMMDVDLRGYTGNRFQYDGTAKIGRMNVSGGASSIIGGIHGSH